MTNLSLRGILDILEEYQVTLRKVSNAIEWKYNYEDNTAWRVLFVLDELRGSEVELDVNETHLIWKLNNQFEWLDLVSIEDLVVLADTGYLDEIEERIEHLEDLTDNSLKSCFRGQPVAPFNKKEEMIQYLPMPNNMPNKGEAQISPNRVDLWPIDVKYPCVLSQLSVSITTARTNALLNIVLYDSDSITGLPNNLLFKSDDLVCSSTGQKTDSNAIFLTAGRYWIGRYAFGQTIVLYCRRYDSNLCDFNANYSSMSVANSNSGADQIYNAISYFDTEVLESLSGVEYSYSNISRIIYGKISSLYDIMMGNLTHNGVTLAGPIFDIIKATDDNYYILSGDKVYRSADLTTFTEIYIDGAITTGFRTLCEVSGNRLITADQDTLFIKHFGFEDVNYVGDWAAGTYNLNEIVSHSDLLWIALATTALEPTLANSAGWAVYPATYAGAWDIGNVPYAVDTIVTNAGSLFISRQETSEEPTTITADWMEFGEQGFIKSTYHTVTNENAVGLYINGSSDSSKVFVTHANVSCQVTVFDLDDDLFSYNTVINTAATTNKPYTKPIKFATDSFIIASSSDDYGYAIVRCDAVNPIETLTSETLIDTNIVFTQTASYIYAVGRNSAEEMFCLKIEDVEGTLTSTEKTFASVNAAEITSIQAMDDDVFVFGGSDYYWTDNYFDGVYLLTSLTSTCIANASLLENDIVYFVNNDTTYTIYRTTKFERPEA